MDLIEFGALSVYRTTRLDSYLRLPMDVRDALWSALAARTRRSEARAAWTTEDMADSPNSFEANGDVLLEIAPPHYFEILCEIEVPRSGMVRCPVHDDFHPSCRVYPDPAQGWYCFGCNAGGSIYDLAGALWQMDTRGAQFVELRQRLARVMLGEAA